VIVKATDLIEMHGAVNAARAAAGVPPASFDTVAAGMPIRWSHWRELQIAIGAIPAPP
jgi:hypothetical protein